jgi:hypothetical protein
MRGMLWAAAISRRVVSSEGVMTLPVGLVGQERQRAAISGVRAARRRSKSMRYLKVWSGSSSMAPGMETKASVWRAWLA